MSTPESRFSSLVRSVRGMLAEVWSQGMGRLGLILLAWFIVMSVYASITIPPKFASMWSDLNAWKEYPLLVPPEWVKLFGVPVAPHYVKEMTRPSESDVTVRGFEQNFTARYRLDVPVFPNERGVVVTITSYKPTVLEDGAEVEAYVTIVLERPDGISIILSQTPRAISTTPVSLAIDPILAARQVMEAFNRVYNANYSEAMLEKIQTDIVRFLFGKPGRGGEVVPLTGTYRIVVMVDYRARGHSPKEIADVIESERAGVRGLRVVVAGSAYGLFGTDLYGRDIWLAMLFSFPIELLIGVFAAVVATIIGVTLGIISGYYGGWVDELIQRVVDVMANIPRLPILVLVGAIVQATIVDPWMRLLTIIGVLIVFGWGGLAIMVRSMTLSIKAEPYIEAARAIGAGNLRIMLRYILPQIMPYVMATLVFSVPDAILAEAGLSVLGIEHGLPTWGRLLADARASLRYDVWWWIFPPGILIALISLTFVLLGMAIEVIVEPRLRGR